MSPIFNSVMIGNFQVQRHAITRAWLAPYFPPVERFTHPPIPVPILTQQHCNNKKRGDTHEARRGDCGNHEARGDRDPLRLSGQSSDRIRGQCRHPPDHGAAGAHRRAHGGRDLAGDLGALDRRVLHAAWPGRGERHGRRRAMLRRIGPCAGAADGLCAPARQYRAELQFQPRHARLRQIRRADHARQRSLQHLSPRLHAI